MALLSRSPESSDDRLRADAWASSDSFAGLAVRFPFWRRRSLSLLSWNVWFGLDKPHRRWTELISILGSLQPDVVALQEVTDPFLRMLRKAPWVRRRYEISDPSGESLGSYGNLIVSRLPLERVRVLALDSEMDRKLVVAQARAADATWAFASVHLESLRESADRRAKQLTQVLEALAPYPEAALMGDFNFCSSWIEENGRIPSDYLDVWPAVRSDDGFTVDTELNEMRGREAQTAKRVRFDRILIRSTRCSPMRTTLVGTKSIRGEKPKLYPSDHFGLHATLRLAKASASA